ncbi:MAG: type II secretion system F family protein [Pseudomonadota bacterium]|nr:type II secretion system F family protein [Pseudomonadota bacterium]
MTTAALAAAFIASVLVPLTGLALFLGLRAMRPPSRLGQRVELYGGHSAAAAPVVESPRVPFKERVLKPAVLRVVRTLGSLGSSRSRAKLQMRLEQAGDPGGIGPVEFAGAKLCLTLIMGALAVQYLLSAAKVAPAMLLLLLLATLLAMRLPDIWISRRTKRRQVEMIKVLPDALDMLTIAVGAGLSFDQAVGELVARWNNELSREFRRVLSEIGLGKSRREALENFSRRSGVSDIVSFVVAINHAEELGASLGPVLKVQSQEMRTRRRQRAQEAANKVPVKMMFPMVMLIFPAIFAVVLGPTIPQLIDALSNVPGVKDMFNR